MDAKFTWRCHLVSVLIILTMLLDWWFIFYLVGHENIISHWTLVVPVLGTFFFILSLFARLGLYAQRIWGFFAALFVILFTWVTYYYFYIHGGKELLFDNDYQILSGLLVLNTVLFFYIIYLLIRYLTSPSPH